MLPVIASRPDGLGTRLLTIVNARRLADRLGTGLSVAWPSLVDRHYDLTKPLLKQESVDEIFEGGVPFRDRDDVPVVVESDWADKRVLCLHGIYDQLDQGDMTTLARLAEGFDVLLYDLPMEVRLAAEPAMVPAPTTASLWQQLNLSADVRATFDRLAEANDLINGVAVHMRRGDLASLARTATQQELIDWGATQLFQRLLPVETAVRLVGQHYAGAPSVVVCSEDSSMVDRLAERLPDHRVFSSRGCYPPDSNQAALLDLMLLANADVLISPFKSYFSECADTIGRCRLHNAGLDIPALIDELDSIMDAAPPADHQSRRAILYMVGYKNLWYEPDSSYRAELLSRAIRADRSIVERMEPAALV